MAPSVPLLRSLLRHGAGLAAAALIVSTAQAAEVATMKIERVVSPGGIEAWLVESHANPLIAMRFAFRGGAAQDPKGKDRRSPCAWISTRAATSCSAACRR
jgi:zinc protease